MTSNDYRVTFLIKKGGYRYYVIDIPAANRKKAREIAEMRWNRLDGHMFHLRVRRIKDTEEFLYHWFVEVDYKKGVELYE